MDSLFISKQMIELMLEIRNHDNVTKSADDLRILYDTNINVCVTGTSYIDN